VRRIADCYERREFDQIDKYYATAVLTISAVAVTLFALLCLAKPEVTRLIGIPEHESRVYSTIITGVFALSVLTFVVDIVACMLSGLGRSDLYKYSQLVTQAGFFADLPVYEICVNLSMRLRNLFESGQRALMPETSRLVSSADEPGHEVKSLIRSSLKGLIIGATPLYLLLLMFAGPLTRLWLGHSFVP